MAHTLSQYRFDSSSLYPPQTLETPPPLKAEPDIDVQHRDAFKDLLGSQVKFDVSEYWPRSRTNSISLGASSIALPPLPQVDITSLLPFQYLSTSSKYAKSPLPPPPRRIRRPKLCLAPCGLDMAEAIVLVSMLDSQSESLRPLGIGKIIRKSDAFLLLGPALERIIRHPKRFGHTIEGARIYPFRIVRGRVPNVMMKRR